MTDERMDGAGGHGGAVGRGANLRLLVELVPHQMADGDRSYTADELAAGVRSRRRHAGGDAAAVLEAVLAGASDVVPAALVVPLAELFGAHHRSHQRSAGGGDRDP